MSTFPGPANAIVYAQFNIQGRWRRLLSVAIGYGVVIGALIWLTYVASSPDLRGWVAGMCMLQIVNLLVFGSFRVDSAVRGDVTSRMLESHRLMPATPLGGMLGYIFGAPLQTLLLAAVNFLIGAACCSISHLSLNTWALVNFVLCLFAVFLWSMLAQFAFVARGGFLMLLIAGVIIISMSQNSGLSMLPALAVIVHPLLAQHSVFETLVSSGGSVDLTSYFVSFAGQMAIILIAIRVGMRRYQSSTIAGISAWLGLLTLIVWVGLSLAFFNSPDLFAFSRSFFASEPDRYSILWMAFATSSLLALVPIGSAAWTAQLANRSGDPSAKRPRFALQEVITTLAAIVIVCGLLTEVPNLNVPAVSIVPASPGFPSPHVHSIPVEAAVHSIVIVAIFLCSMACLFSWGYLIRQRAWIFVLIWVLITWLGPVISDAIYRSVTNDNRRQPTIIMGFSPAGALALIWTEPGAITPEVSVVPGIIGQLALGFVPTAILLLTQERHRRRLAQKALLAAEAPVAGAA